MFAGQTFSEVVGTGTPPWGLAHHRCMSTSFATAGLASLGLIDGAMKERCLAFHYQSVQYIILGFPNKEACKVSYS